MHYTRLLYVDLGHTAYYGIGESKFRKILEMTFPTPPRHHRLPMDQGFAAQPCGLAEQQGVAYAKTVADAMDLKLDADNPADREKLRRAVLDLDDPIGSIICPFPIRSGFAFVSPTQTQSRQRAS
jgi:hypothetical protein